MSFYGIVQNQLALEAGFKTGCGFNY